MFYEKFGKWNPCLKIQFMTTAIELTEMVVERFGMSSKEDRITGCLGFLP